MHAKIKLILNNLLHKQKRKGVGGKIGSVRISDIQLWPNFRIETIKKENHMNII